MPPYAGMGLRVSCQSNTAVWSSSALSSQMPNALPPQYELDDTKSKQDELDQGKVIAAHPGTVEHIEIDQKESKRVLRKIDWHLMPLMCVVYGLQFVSGCWPRLDYCVACPATGFLLILFTFSARQNFPQLRKV